MEKDSHTTRYKHAIINSHFQYWMNNRSGPTILVFAIQLRLSGSMVYLQNLLP